MFTRRKQDFDITCKAVFDTSEGKRLLKYLTEDFLNKSVKGNTVEDTYYNIGQHDFIKRLLRSLKPGEDLSEIDTIKSDYTVGGI